MDKCQCREDGILKKVEQSIARGSDGRTAKEHLQSFFATLNKIKAVDDDGAQENDLSDYVNNDSDGVACKLASDIEEIQKKKLADLAKVHREIFPDAEDPSDNVPVVSGDADINAKGRYGYTRLTEAAAKGNFDLCKQLVSRGARWDIPDNGGQTAWDKAFARGHDNILRLFDPKFVRVGRIPQYNFHDE